MAYRPEPRWPIECLRESAPAGPGVLRLYFHMNGEESSFDLNLNAPVGADLLVVLDGRTIFTSPTTQSRGIGGSREVTLG